MNRLTNYREMHHSEDGFEAIQVVMLLSIGVLVMLLFGTLYNDYVEDPANIAVRKAVAGETGAWAAEGDTVIPDGTPFDEQPFGGDSPGGSNNSIGDDGPQVVSTVPLGDNPREPTEPDEDPFGGDDIDLEPEPDPISTDPDFDFENPPADPREPGQPEPGIGPESPFPPSQSDSENNDTGCLECECGKDFLLGVGSKLLDEIGGLLELAWNLITSPIDTTKGIVNGIGKIIEAVLNGEFDEAAKDIIPKTYELVQVYNDPSVPQSVKCGLLGEAAVELVATIGGPGKIAKFTKRFKRPKGSKPPKSNTPGPKPDGDTTPGQPAKTPDGSDPPKNNIGGNNGTGGPPKKPDEPPKLLPPPPLGVNSTVGKKILYGEPKPGKPREIRGGHSPRVQGNDDFRLTDITKNPDGTKTATIQKRLPDGSWSKKKKNHTIAPNNWTDEKIMIATRDTGLASPKFRRSRDGATLHVQKVDGVEWVVIKDSSGKVTSSYPTGGNSPAINQGGFDEQLY